VLKIAAKASEDNPVQGWNMMCKKLENFGALVIGGRVCENFFFVEKYKFLTPFGHVGIQIHILLFLMWRRWPQEHSQPNCVTEKMGLVLECYHLPSTFCRFGSQKLISSCALCTCEQIKTGKGTYHDNFVTVKIHWLKQVLLYQCLHVNTKIRIWKYLFV
jgi:hypothetical protein